MSPTETSTVTRTIPLGGVDQLTLFGAGDRNLKRIEELSGTRMVVRGGELRVQGGPLAAARAAALVEHLIELVQTGSGFDASDVGRFYDQIDDGGDAPLARLEAGKVVVRGTQKIIKPKTAGQETYLQAIARNDIVEVLRFSFLDALDPAAQILRPEQLDEFRAAGAEAVDGSDHLHRGRASGPARGHRAAHHGQPPRRADPRLRSA